MKRNLDDRLIQLAFGDLTPEEERKLRQEVAGNPEAQRVLRDCGSLREDFKLLRTIPDDQLSPERLKQAILERGLKREAPTSSRYGWLWAPTAVALFAFAFVTYRNSRPVQLPLSAVAIRTSQADSQPILRDPSLSTKKEIPLVQSSVSRGETVADTSSDDSATVARPAKSTKVSSPRMSLMTAAAESVLDQQPDVSSEVAMAEPQRDSLILIGNDSDDDTGAKRATEVDSVANVLISG